MNMKSRRDFHPCVPGAFGGGLRRTAYFDGMVLTEADMVREQTYWSMKRKLTNRALGQGVVWGLNLVWDHKSRCFTLCPGYGLSCCGDDLVVECPQTICEGDLVDPCSEDFRRLFADKTDPCACDPDPKGPVEACLYLEYVECPEDPRQVFEDPCAESPQGCRYGAVRETTRLVLVKPPRSEPTGPIARFCQKIDEIRAALNEQGVAMPAMAFEAEPALPLSIGGKDASGNPVNETAQLALAKDASITAKGIAGADVTVKLTPPPGHVFTALRQGGKDISGVETLFGLEMHIVRSGMVTSPTRVVLEATSLFGGVEALEAKVEIAASIDGSEASLSARVISVNRVARRQNCFAAFADGFRLNTGDTGCVVRTLALAVLSGWFAGLLGSPACASKDEPAPSPALQQLAWLIAWLAWWLLFRIDIRDDRAQGAVRCLRALFEAWCEGMHYKGPLCHCHTHGIFLGCVKVSPKGKILCFDEWKHRRYVLTGPLINHWGGQFGFAPVDVVATRLASWICCIAGVEVPRPQSPQFTTSNGRLTLFGASLASIGASDGASDIDGVAIAARRDVGLREFASLALRRLERNTLASPGAVSGYEIYRAPGLGLEMAVPAEGAVRVPKAEAGLADLPGMKTLNDLPALAIPPARDFLEVLLQRLTLAELDDSAAGDTFAPMVAALDASDITSLAELFAVGPEEVVAKVRPQLADAPEFAAPGAVEAAVNSVFAAAGTTMAAAADALATDAAARSAEKPFLRDSLNDSGVIAALGKAVNKTLRGRGLYAHNLRAIADEAIALRR